MKEPSSSSGALVIDDPKAAALLLEPHYSQMLKPFFGAEASVGEAARQLDLDPGTAFYRVRRLLDLGIVKVAREQVRRGRALKLYRTSAERFFVPFRHAPVDDLTAFVRLHDEHWQPRLLRGIARALEQDQQGARTWGLELYKHKEGLLVYDLSAGPETAQGASDYHVRGIINIWDTRYYLGPEDVNALSRDLEEVLARYRPKRSGPRQVLRLALAPFETA
ncbi:hypothetical protein BH24DEI1_BH24DEI1_15360 [soil metagenome]|jgi:DNA-binding Lrp family transcriptional regulator|nr:hypothetical protein [Deinococcota bacterium]